MDPIRRCRLHAGSSAAGIVVALLMSAAGPGVAQRASENAVTAADDAFGLSVGREAIGIYSSDNVRGFSAIDAGNVRLDGLYFDAVRLPSSRLQQSSAIRVGIAAQGFSFPAPTGVVDYVLRHPGDESKMSLFTSADSYGNLVGELDAEIPVVKNTLGIGLGLAGYRESYYNGTGDRAHAASMIFRWRPTASVELLPFWSRTDVRDADASPQYIPAGEYLPPRISRRQFEGPAWARSRVIGLNYGGLARWTPSGVWTVQAGLFRSSMDFPIGFTNLFVGLTPDGRADQLILVDPPARNASTSGELRVSHTVADGSFLHKTVVSLRGRVRDSLYNGSNEIDLGEVRLGQSQTAPRPAFEFAQKDRDRIKQATAGIAHEIRWRDLGQLSLGVQKTDYTKHVTPAGETTSEARASPYLFSAAAVVQPAAGLALYASYASGLEDSGSAPGSAVNRNEPLPAIRTRQVDAGTRWALTKELKLVAGVFEVDKPYFQLDATNRYTLLGDIGNRGVELSLSGSVTPRLDVVAGAVLSDPRVSGQASRTGLIGREPVDKARVRLNSNLDWRPEWPTNVSFQMGVTHLGRRAATTDNLVHLSARTLVDLGARYASRIADKPAQLRLSVANVANVYGFDLYGAGAYDIISGRVVQLSLGVDL